MTKLKQILGNITQHQKEPGDDIVQNIFSNSNISRQSPVTAKDVLFSFCPGIVAKDDFWDDFLLEVLRETREGVNFVKVSPGESASPPNSHVLSFWFHETSSISSIRAASPSLKQDLLGICRNTYFDSRRIILLGYQPVDNEYALRKHTVITELEVERIKCGLCTS